MHGWQKIGRLLPNRSLLMLKFLTVLGMNIILLFWVELSLWHVLCALLSNLLKNLVRGQSSSPLLEMPGFWVVYKCSIVITIPVVQAIRQWDQALREKNDYRDALAKVKSKCDHVYMCGLYGFICMSFNWSTLSLKLCLVLWELLKHCFCMTCGRCT